MVHESRRDNEYYEKQNQLNIRRIRALSEKKFESEKNYSKNFHKGDIVIADPDYKVEGNPFDYVYRGQVDCLKALKKYGGIVNDMESNRCLVEFLLLEGEKPSKCYFCKKRKFWFNNESIKRIELNNHEHLYKCTLSADREIFSEWNVLRYHKFIHELLERPWEERARMPWEHCLKSFSKIELYQVEVNFRLMNPLKLIFNGKAYYFNIGLVEPELTEKMIMNGEWGVYSCTN